MKSWYDIYKDRMNERYEKHIRKKYKPFIDRILSKDTNVFTEYGCGAGNITRELRRRLIQNDVFSYSIHTLIDLCPQMLSLAIQNNSDPNCVFRCDDIISPKSYVNHKHPERIVAHSHGVLEHFDDDAIGRILTNIDKNAWQQVHFVPGAKYEKPSRGDERLLTPEQWDSKIEFACKNLLGRGVRSSVDTFNNGYDIIIEITREFA